MRWLLAIAAAFVLAGCGAGMSGHAGVGVVADAAAPPIVALDEQPPDDVLWFLQAGLGLEPSADDSAGSGQAQGSAVCLVWDATAPDADKQIKADGPCPQASAEQKAEARAQDERYQQAVRPASGAEPRVIARLPLMDGGDLLFTAWKNNADALCWEADQTTPDGSTGSGPSGPCTEQARAAYPDSMSTFEPCAAICLDSESGTRGDDTELYFLAGTVAPNAEALRVTVAGDATATYPLNGPTALDTDRRIFMLELGTHDWRKLELIQGGAVVATSTMPAYFAAWEDCVAQIGSPPAPPQDADTQWMLDAWRPYQEKVTACIDALGATPPDAPQLHTP